MREPGTVAQSDPYGELALAILVWDRANREGLRSDLIAAERRLTMLAGLLEEAGWKLGRKGT